MTSILCCILARIIINILKKSSSMIDDELDYKHWFLTRFSVTGYNKSWVKTIKIRFYLQIEIDYSFFLI